MRRQLLLLTTLLLHISARGQTGYTYDYWFDCDRSTLQSGIAASESWQLQADLTGLQNAIHTIHLQVRDAEGNQSSPVTRYFVKTITPQEAAGRYWFDDDVAHIHDAPQVQGVFDIDVSGISEGFHALHYQLMGANGSVSSTATRTFYKVYIPSSSGWRCWFDNDYSTLQTGTDMSSALLLDVTGLKDGYHALHIQVDGGAASASTPITKPFVKIPQTDGVDYLTCICSIDDQLFKQEKVSAKGGVVEWNFDVSTLPQGFHRMFVMVVTPSGAASAAFQSFFMRETTRAEFGQMKCIYAIDGSEFYTEAGMLDKGTYHFDLDVSSLDDGLHRISYMLSNGAGVSTKAQVQFFVKNPIGGNGITEYWYWLNNMGDQQARKVTLSERQDPFSLITLLPVESQPIRSQLFQFRMEQGQPVVYAKNDIRLRFYDAAGRFTDVTKRYVDEQVRQDVTDVTLLNAGDRKTTARPGENIIKWYKVEALRGDSMAFKTDYPCTVQLFSPTGEELYNASGPNAIKYGGSYATEDGTYYLALHDVTAQSGNHLTVDYQHIDKYAVLSYTPEELGVLPCGQIVGISGNGFDKLKSALLRKGDKEIIAMGVYADGKSEAELLFELQGNETKGLYDLVLIFEEEGVEQELIVNDAITLTTPDFSDFNIEITDPRTVASPYPVSIKITNTGNLTYANIPFMMAYDNVEKITDMSLLNFEIVADTALVNNGLKFVYDIENFKGKDIKSRMIPTIIDVLRPGETKTFKLGFKANNHTTYNVYAWAGTPWSLHASETMSAIQAMAAESSGSGSSSSGNPGSSGSGSGGSGSSPGSSGSGASAGSSFAIILPGGGSGGGNSSGGVATSCVPDPCDIAGLLGGLEECLCGTALGLGTTLGGIQLALQNRHNAAMREQLDESGLFDDSSEMFPTHRLPHPGDILWNWAGHCLPGKAGEAADALNAAMDMMGNDPCPEPPSHPCNQYNPGDPNDIFGYMAESGSKYMKEGTTDVYYTIEFENDPKIATASAHTIVVKDTLDTSRFDLSTFAATGVKIGDKEMKLDGEKNFSKKTLDLRPEIDVIAQISLALNETKGIATWTIESLDPMSLEPTVDAMQGVLPVNVNGNGQGELTFDIKLKPGMVEGESVGNRAGIVFDQEDVIMTPVWTNTVDATSPVSRVAEVTMASDTTATVRIEATDEMSKPWKYNLYVQENADGEWVRKATNIAVDSVLQIPVAEGVNYGFYVAVTDSAGNVEQKNAEREFTLEVFGSQVDTNTRIDLAEGWNWMSHNQQEVLALDALKPKAQRMVGQTEETIKDARFGWMGNLEELQPTQMYKVQMAEAMQVQLSGRLFNAGFRSIPLYQGWNWIGYPASNVMTPAEALAKLEAEEGDMIIGQDGMATYTDGAWTGTLLELQPGQGYMYRSVSDKNLFYNATAQASARQMTLRRGAADTWSVNKRKYPNVMGVIATLQQNGMEADVDEWIVAAFCGDECRGVAQVVNGVLMMNVYGIGSELLTFYAMNRDTEEVMQAQENEDFRADVLGTMTQPYRLSIDEATGIKTIGLSQPGAGSAVYDLQGRRIGETLSSINAQLRKGVYIVTDGRKRVTQKVVRK